MPAVPSTKILGLVFLGLAGCAVQNSDGTVSVPSGDVPAEVLEAAAPNQDLSFVELRESDNCYWYRYRGPVETTMLPLRTRSGRPICAQVAEAAPAT